MKKSFSIFILIILGIGVYFFLARKTSTSIYPNQTDEQNLNLDEGRLESTDHPLSIATLRNGDYPGSEITIEQTLTPGSNYQLFLASYKSEGLKIFALLTVPNGESPINGWPVIIFNHGYIPPAQYQTTERYVAYVDGFSRNGYIVFKPDYRGHGNSEGEAMGGYGSNAYIIDALNAVASIKKYSQVDPKQIGMWGHSMGGSITLKSMVVSQDVKVGVIWAGVVGSYADLLNNWRRRNPNASGFTGRGGSWRQGLINQYGNPEQNPQFWNSISATAFLNDISGPLQLHHGTADTSVPVAFSEKLEKLMQEAGKEVEFFAYTGDDHNLSNSFSTAMNRSVEFFNKYLKNGG